MLVSLVFYNPNTFVGLVGKVQKYYLPKEEGREGGEKKRAARPRGSRLEPEPCRVLGEGSQLHAMRVV